MSFQADASPVVLATPDELRQRIRKQSKLKGRQPDDASLREVQALGPDAFTLWSF